MNKKGFPCYIIKIEKIQKKPGEYSSKSEFNKKNLAG